MVVEGDERERKEENESLIYDVKTEKIVMKEVPFMK